MKILVLRALRLCALAAFAMASPFAWGQAAYTAGAGLTNTPHDFSGNTAATPNAGTSAISGLCTYCHTPHQGSTDNVLAWNRDLSPNTFSWTAGSATSGGTTYSTFGPTYTGTSVKCLSCHDGSVAVGQVNVFDATLNVDFGDPAITDPARLIADTGTGSMDGNHPVAMPFPFQQALNTYNGQQTGSGVLLAEFVADPTSNGIRLYNDDGTGTITVGTSPAQTGIECASCHDPHNGSATTQDIYFLRGLMGTNGANYICIKCHNKN